GEGLELKSLRHGALTREAEGRESRKVAKKAEEYLRSSGIADTGYFGPEAEFYIFVFVRYDTTANESFYHVDSEAGAWNTGRDEDGRNLGYKVRHKQGYFPVPPYDHFADLRDAMVRTLHSVGFTVEKAHHEVGTGGQAG